MLSFLLFALPLHLTVVVAFQVQVPSTVTTGSPATATWIRTSGDSTTFSLLLRQNSQDHGGTIFKTITSTSDSTGTADFTCPETGTFLVEVVSNTQISQDEVPNTLASSDSFQANAGSNDQSSSSTNNQPTTATQVPPAISSSVNSGSSSSSSTGSANNNSGSNGNSGSGSGSDSLNSQSITSDSSSTSNQTPSISSSTDESTIASVASTTSTSLSTSSVSPAEKASLNPSTTGVASGSDTTADPLNSVSQPSYIVSAPSTSSSSSTVGSSTSSPDPNQSPVSAVASKKSKTGIIVGSVFGALAFLFIALCLLLSFTRYRRRQRTNEFQRDLMVRRFGSSPLIFNPVTPPSTLSRTDRTEEDYNSTPSGVGDIKSRSVHSSVSSESRYDSSRPTSDSPDVFYTAVPRPLQQQNQSQSQLTPTPPAPASAFASNALSNPSPPLQLAPGFVFPARRPDGPMPPSLAPLPQLPPPRTDRQMLIHDNVVQLQRLMINLQAFNGDGAHSDEIQVIQDKVKVLEAMENSDWALGRADQVPAGFPLN